MSARDIPIGINSNNKFLVLLIAVTIIIVGFYDFFILAARCNIC